MWDMSPEWWHVSCDARDAGKHVGYVVYIDSNTVV